MCLACMDKHLIVSDHYLTLEKNKRTPREIQLYLFVESNQEITLVAVPIFHVPIKHVDNY